MTAYRTDEQTIREVLEQLDYGDTESREALSRLVRDRDAVVVELNRVQIELTEQAQSTMRHAGWVVELQAEVARLVEETRRLRDERDESLRCIHEVAQEIDTNAAGGGVVARDKLLAFLKGERVVHTTYTLKQAKEMGWLPPGEVTRLRDALTFYSDRWKFSWPEGDAEPPILADDGAHARAALDDIGKRETR